MSVQCRVDVGQYLVSPRFLINSLYTTYQQVKHRKLLRPLEFVRQRFAVARGRTGHLTKIELAAIELPHTAPFNLHLHPLSILHCSSTPQTLPIWCLFIPFIRNPEDPIGYAVITVDMSACGDIWDGDWEPRRLVAVRVVLWGQVRGHR